MADEIRIVRARDLKTPGWVRLPRETEPEGYWHRIIGVAPTGMTVKIHYDGERSVVVHANSPVEVKDRVDHPSDKR